MSNKHYILLHIYQHIVKYGHWVLHLWYMLQWQRHNLGMIQLIDNTFRAIIGKISTKIDLLQLAPSTLSCSELIISTKTNRHPGPCLCLCLCFTGQQELSVRADRQAVGGMLGGLGLRMWEGGRGMTGPQLSALCTYIWLSVLLALR